MLNANTLDALDRREDWGQALVEQANARGASGYPLYAAWEMTGDRSYLERLYGDEVQRASQRMFMMTEGHWWSDRVEVYSEFLQRARLGGMALRRNRRYGRCLRTCAWAFADPAGDAYLRPDLVRHDRKGPRRLIAERPFHLASNTQRQGPRQGARLVQSKDFTLSATACAVMPNCS